MDDALMIGSHGVQRDAVLFAVGDQLTELWLSAGVFRGTLAADTLPETAGPDDAAR